MTSDQTLMLLEYCGMLLFFICPLFNFFLLLLSISNKKLKNTFIPYILLIIQLIVFAPLLLDFINPQERIPIYDALAYPLLIFFYIPIILLNMGVTVIFYQRSKK